MTSKVLQIFDSIRDLRSLNKFISRQFFFEAVKSNLRVREADSVKKARVLVLAPHPDDEVIGCGGVIKMHTEFNNLVKVIYLTDGSGGSKKRLSSREKTVLVKLREKEVQQSCEVLGVEDYEFWHYPDGNLRRSNAIVKLLQNTVLKFKPTEVYLPIFLDYPSDHVETAKIFAAAIKKIDLPRLEIFSFETWMPVSANRLFLIDETVGAKKEALKKYKSQLEDRDYVQAALALNKYRGLIFGTGEYAEAFFACNKKLYLELMRLSGLS